MKSIVEFVTAINNVVWGPAMLVLILGTGLYLQLRLKFMPMRRIVDGFRLIWASRHRDPEAKGEISPFAALMTSLAATVGTGNIAGVATAIAMGGPGALFWMWMTACVGMATKYAEVVLAVHYRETDSQGEQVGGPMVAIKNGLSKNWRWLGFLFALFGGLAGFGIGNMVQANSVADVLKVTFGVSPWVSGLVMAVLTGLVLLGGIRRIGGSGRKAGAVHVHHLRRRVPADLRPVRSAYSGRALPGVPACLYTGRGHRRIFRCGRDDGHTIWRGARRLFQ